MTAETLTQYASIVLAIIALVGTAWQLKFARASKVTDDIVARQDKAIEQIRNELNATKVDLETTRRELATTQVALIKANFEHTACREENAELRAELTELQAKVATLEGKA